MQDSNTTSKMSEKLKTPTYLADGKWSKVAEICVSLIREDILTLDKQSVIAAVKSNGNS